MTTTVKEPMTNCKKWKDRHTGTYSWRCQDGVPCAKDEIIDLLSKGRGEVTSEERRNQDMEATECSNVLDNKRLV